MDQKMTDIAEGFLSFPLTYSGQSKVSLLNHILITK